MSAIIRQTDKRTGITYEYESVSFWDKEKQQSRAKRTLIGKLDPETGEVIPARKKRTQTNIEPTKQGPVPATEVNRQFFGATYLLDAIGSKSVSQRILSDVSRIGICRSYPWPTT